MVDGVGALADELAQGFGSVAADRPAQPPIAAADQLQAASGVKVTQQGGGAAPMPLIIDVQQALAAARARAALGAQR